MITQDRFTKALLSLSEPHELRLSAEQIGQLYEHVRLMIEWNRHINLTRITDLNEILIKHLLDALIPARYLPQSGLTLDVGTGPGFPGVPLKIFSPQLTVVLLEAHRKKVSFLKVLLSRLRLKDVQAVQGRWEEWDRIPHPLVKKRFDLIVMRAVRLDSRQLSFFADHILQPGGLFVWWAGPRAASEKELDSPASMRSSSMTFRESIPYRLPSVSSTRFLLVWQNRA